MMKTIKTGLAFFVPAALAAYLFLRPAIEKHGAGNIPTSTGIAAAGIAFVVGAVVFALYLKMSRR